MKENHRKIVAHANVTDDGVKSWHIHSHEYDEIMYYISGEGVLKTEQGNIPFSPGLAVFIPAGVLHGSTSHHGFKNISFGLETNASPHKEIAVKQDGEQKDLWKLADMIYRLTYQSGTEHYPVLSALFSALSLMISTPKKSGVIDEMLTEIGIGFTDPMFDVAELIRRTGYSDDYVRTIFKEQTGVTPLRYLTDLRLTHADTVLKSGHFTVKQAAESSGFLDPLYFSRLYKRKYGFSPKKTNKN